MKSNLPLITILCISAFTSCKKFDTLKKSVPLANGLSIQKGFQWQNSRNISFAVNVTDTRFGSSMHMISIYDGDPAAGGRLVSKGAATVKTAFASRIYLTRQLAAVYVVKKAPDHTTSVSKIELTSTNISISISK